MFDYDDLDMAEDVKQVAMTAPAQESLRSLVADMSSRVDSIKARVDQKERDRVEAPHRRRKATDAVSTASLSFAEFLGISQSQSNQEESSSRGLRVARSRPSGKEQQMVDCAEYLVVLTGEFRLEKRDEKIMLREGDGIFLEAGERVVWTWDRTVQFITITLPERTRQAKTTEHPNRTQQGLW